MAAILWKFKLFDVALIWLQIRNLRPRISGETILNPIYSFLTPIYYYLPKFSIFASMFVWRFVCLFVCLSVCNIHDTGRTVQAMNTKLGTYMYLGSG